MDNTKLFLKNIAYAIADTGDGGEMLDKIIAAMQAYPPKNKELMSLTSKHIISERKCQNFGADCRDYANLILSIGKISDIREAALIDEAFDENDYI